MHSYIIWTKSDTSNFIFALLEQEFSNINFLNIKVVKGKYIFFQTILNKRKIKEKIRNNFLLKNENIYVLDILPSDGIDILKCNSLNLRLKISTIILRHVTKNIKLKNQSINKPKQTGIKNKKYQDILDELIGLEDIKEYVHSFAKFLKIENERKKNNLPLNKIGLHMVFKGPPGTGKTTIARVFGSIYKQLGYLKKGHVVEVDRENLVGAYIGKTEEKTKEVLKSALDGVLFIDEAYSLNTKGENDFGKIAIDTILKFMEDNRDRIVVIVAGYSKNMDDFIKSNPGLKSRFNETINFKSYNYKELTKIFENLCNKQKITYPVRLRKHLNYLFKKIIKKYDPSNFGNAREVRNLFESILIEQSNRLDIVNIDPIALNIFTEQDISNCSLKKYNIPIKRYRIDYVVTNLFANLLM